MSQSQPSEELSVATLPPSVAAARLSDPGEQPSSPSLVLHRRDPAALSALEEKAPPSSWQRALREFLLYDTKLNDEVKATSQRFVKAGGCSNVNFALSTLLDAAWSVSVIVLEAMETKRLPPPVQERFVGEGSRRYAELLKQFEECRASWLSEVSELRDMRRKTLYGSDIIEQYTAAKERQDVFRFVPERAIVKAEHREYFKAAVEEGVKMMLLDSAGPGREQVRIVEERLYQTIDQLELAREDIDRFKEKVREVEREREADKQRAQAEVVKERHICRARVSGMEKEVAKANKERQDALRRAEEALEQAGIHAEDLWKVVNHDVQAIEVKHVNEVLSQKEKDLAKKEQETVHLNKKLKDKDSELLQRKEVEKQKEEELRGIQLHVKEQGERLKESEGLAQQKAESLKEAHDRMQELDAELVRLNDELRQYAMSVRKKSKTLCMVEAVFPAQEDKALIQEAFSDILPPDVQEAAVQVDLLGSATASAAPGDAAPAPHASAAANSAAYRTITRPAAGELEPPRRPEAAGAAGHPAQAQAQAQATVSLPQSHGGGGYMHEAELLQRLREQVSGYERQVTQLRRANELLEKRVADKEVSKAKEVLESRRMTSGSGHSRPGSQQSRGRPNSGSDGPAAPTGGAAAGAPAAGPSSRQPAVPRASVTAEQPTGTDEQTLQKAAAAQLPQLRPTRSSTGSGSGFRSLPTKDCLSPGETSPHLTAAGDPNASAEASPRPLDGDERTSTDEEVSVEMREVLELTRQLEQMALKLDLKQLEAQGLEQEVQDLTATLSETRMKLEHKGNIVIYSNSPTPSTEFQKRPNWLRGRMQEKATQTTEKPVFPESHKEAAEMSSDMYPFWEKHVEAMEEKQRTAFADFVRALQDGGVSPTQKAAEACERLHRTGTARQDPGQKPQQMRSLVLTTRSRRLRHRVAASGGAPPSRQYVLGCLPEVERPPASGDGAAVTPGDAMEEELRSSRCQSAPHLRTLLQEQAEALPGAWLARPLGGPAMRRSKPKPEALAGADMAVVGAVSATRTLDPLPGLAIR